MRFVSMSWKWYAVRHDSCVTAVHVEDIIFHMFQYIQKLRTEGPQEWVFEECKVIQSERHSKRDLLIAGKRIN